MTALLDRVTSAFGGRYLIERELGRGGMATVYLAQDPKHGRAVALKVLRPELAATIGPERFLREIRVAARLTHPHILALFESDTVDPGRVAAFRAQREAEHQQAADAISQAITDVHDVLTPAQRKVVADWIRANRPGHGG